MKKHTLLIITALLGFAVSSPAQSLIEKTDAQKVVERIDNDQAELINHIEVKLRSFYAAVNKEGKQQEILDALGTKAGVALQRYAIMRETLLQVKPTANIPATDPKVFKINQNGSVTYVAPPTPPSPPAIPAP